MASEAATIFLVDDDPAMRASLVWALEKGGFRVAAFAHAEEILERYDPERPGCLVLDLRLPSMTGLQLQQALREQGCLHPFIIITGHGDVPQAVTAMRDGAVDFLEKPFPYQMFLDRVREAVERDARLRERRREQESVQRRLDSLTQRERQVLDLVVAGQLTKQIANQLGISTKTVEVHRSHVTKKMQVDSVVQLVRLLSDFHRD